MLNTKAANNYHPPFYYNYKEDSVYFSLPVGHNFTHAKFLYWNRYFAQSTYPFINDYWIYFFY